MPINFPASILRKCGDFCQTSDGSFDPIRIKTKVIDCLKSLSGKFNTLSLDEM